MPRKKSSEKKDGGERKARQKGEKGSKLQVEVNSPSETQVEEEIGPATTADILGIHFVPQSEGKRAIPEEDEIPVPPWVKPEWIKFYRKLIAIRNQLLEQMESLAEDSTIQVDMHSIHEADIGTDHYERDFALSMLSSGQELLYEIEEALKRIERGTYGICELTGKAIPKARLEAIPWARYTVEAQEELERRGLIKKRRLANLGTLRVPGESESEEEEAETENSEGLAEER